MKKKPLRFALAGAGFWSHYQLHGWRELPGCKCVAIFNRTHTKAEKLAAVFGISDDHVYDDYEQMLASEQLDFVDIVTAVEQHAPMTRLAADRGLDVVCQKPMTPDYASAAALVAHCRKRRVKFCVNENGSQISHLPLYRELFLIAPIAESMSASFISIHPKGSTSEIRLAFARSVT